MKKFFLLGWALLALAVVWCNPVFYFTVGVIYSAIVVWGAYRQTPKDFRVSWKERLLAWVTIAVFWPLTFAL